MVTVNSEQWVKRLRQLVQANSSAGKEPAMMSTVPDELTLQADSLRRTAFVLVVAGLV